MNGTPWWLTVSAVLAAVVMAGFILLAIRIQWTAPVVGARWSAAAEAEKARSRVREEAVR